MNNTANHNRENRKRKINHYYWVWSSWQNNIAKNYTKSYFWRTTQQQEVDYIEEVDGKITGYEIKWSEKTKFKAPKLFNETYKTEATVLNRGNFNVFL